MFSSGVLSILVLRPPPPVRRMVCSSVFSSCERRTLACSSSNSDPAHLCYSHLSALRSSGRSAALSLRLASESHLQPQFRRPVGQKQLECCCKQLCHVIKVQIMWASEEEHFLLHRQPANAGCLFFAQDSCSWGGKKVFLKFLPWIWHMTICFSFLSLPHLSTVTFLSPRLSLISQDFLLEPFGRHQAAIQIIKSADLMSSYHVFVAAVKVLCWHRHGKPTHTQVFRLIDPVLLSPGGCGTCGWLNGKILLHSSPAVFIQLHESRYWIARVCMWEAVHQISNLQPLWDFYYFF